MAKSEMTLVARPPSMIPIFMVVAPISGLVGRGMARSVCERIQQLVNGGFAKFGICRVGHLAAGNDLHAQCALGCERNAVARGLAIDQETRAARVLVGDRGPKRVALLANHKKQSSAGALIDAGVVRPRPGRQ